MEYYITQSLLSSWIYYINSDDKYSESAYESFMMALRREKEEKTLARRNGILFETLVNQAVNSEFVQFPNEKWEDGINCIASICKGGIKQVSVSKKLKINNFDFVIYGICDYVKSGTIYDIKKVNRYEYGKYFSSPQHPMYFCLVPEAFKFEYLIFDGSMVYIESYNRCDCEPIESIILRFITFLKKNDLFFLYEKNWTMNDKRKEMISNDF